MKRSPFVLDRFGSGIGLHRVLAAIRRLNIPLERFSAKSVVVTGSNGKGTVATCLAEIATACKLSTGLFTSPHIFQFNERFRINGSNISDDELLELAAEVSNAIHCYQHDNPGDTFGEFEAWFLVALLGFHRKDVEFCVFEAGIGGRYDPTRLIRPNHSCITSIDLEHTGLLGTTLREIALDKFDICPSGKTIVLGYGLEKEKFSLSTMAWLKNIKTCWLSDDILAFNWEVSDAHNRINITWDDNETFWLQTNLLGTFAARNSALALALFRRQFGADILERNAQRIQEGLSHIRSVGRFELIQNAIPILIDFAHTPKAIEGTINDIEEIFPKTDKIILLGTSANHDYKSMLGNISRLGGTFVVSQAFRGLDPSTIKELVLNFNPGANVYIADDPEAAFSQAIERASQNDAMICVIGGLFWGATIRAIYYGLNPKDVDFS